MGSVIAMPPRKRKSTSSAGGTAKSRKRQPRKPADQANSTGSASTLNLPAENASPVEPPPPEPDTFGRLSTAEPADSGNLASYYGQLITVSRTRAAMLGDLLADDYAKRGINALRRITYTTTEEGGSEPSGEVSTALVRLEMEERRTFERLLVKAAELGINSRNADAREKEARARIAVLFAFAELRGDDTQDPEVRRMMQRAVLASADPKRAG